MSRLGQQQPEDGDPHHFHSLILLRLQFHLANNTFETMPDYAFLGLGSGDKSVTEELQTVNTECVSPQLYVTSDVLYRYLQPAGV